MYPAPTHSRLRVETKRDRIVASWYLGTPEIHNSQCPDFLILSMLIEGSDKSWEGHASTPICTVNAYSTYRFSYFNMLRCWFANRLASSVAFVNMAVLQYAAMFVGQMVGFFSCLHIPSGKGLVVLDKIGFAGTLGIIALGAVA